MNKQTAWLVLGGGLLGVSQQIALVVLPLLADIMRVPYEVLVNWQAGGSFLFLLSSVFWAKEVVKRGVSYVVKLACVGFILSNALLLLLWFMHGQLTIELMLTIFILSRLVHGVFSSGIVPQLQISALQIYPHNSIGALAKVSLGGTMARCLTPIACIGLLIVSPIWVFVLPIVLGIFVLLVTPALQKRKVKARQPVKTKQHWGLLLVAFICSFSLCYGQFSLVQVLSEIIPNNSTKVSQWVATNLAITAGFSSLVQLYFIKKRKVNSEKLLSVSVGMALLMACVSALVTNIIAVCGFVAFLFVALNSATLAYTNVIVAKAGKQFTNYITTVHTLGYALGAVFVNFSLSMPYALVSVGLLIAFIYILYRLVVCVYPKKVESL